MKGTFRKMLLALLTLVMMLSLLTTAAFAERCLPAGSPPDRCTVPETL